MTMFNIGICGLIAFAAITFIIGLMEDCECVRREIINTAAWVGYGLLCFCVFFSVMMIL